MRSEHGGGRPAGGPAAPFSRPVAVDRIPVSGQGFHIEADETERAALAGLCGVEEIRRVVFEGRIMPLSGGRRRLKGRLEAELVQACVVTLEPVEERVDEPVDSEYWPAESIDEPRMGAFEFSENDSDGAGVAPEPIVGGLIDIGALAGEVLAAAIDPYPRKAGAVFEWQDETQRTEIHGAGSQDIPSRNVQSREGETGDGTAGADVRGGPFAALEKLRR